jgi:hypothetical protein
MRWLFVTVALLSASLILVAWVSLRDRDPSSVQPPERQIVRIDTEAALTTLGSADCRSGCAVQLLTHTRPHRWLVRVTVKGRPECLQIDLDAFSASPQHGLSGVWPSQCPHRPSVQKPTA